MLVTLLLGIIEFVIFHTRKLKIFYGHLVSNALKVMLFIYDVQYHVPVKLCRAAGSNNVFKITGKLTSDHVKLRPSNLCDILQLE